MSKPFEIRAAGQRGTTEILIYGDIGDSWSDESVQAADFVRDLQQIQANILNVRINSYGGAVSDGIAIYNALRRHPATVNISVDGVAVSSASLITMAGDSIGMAENALMMIHAPWGAAAGNSKDMREMAAMLDKFADAMTSAYAGRLGTDTTKQWLSDGEDHWLTASEAHEYGLIDEISAPLDIAASLPPKQRFTIPEAIMSKTDPNLAKQAEGAVLARIQARNNELMPIFARFSANPGISAIKDQVLSDPSITVDQVRAMMLEEMGKDAEPINQVAPNSPAAWGDNAHQRDFKDAAVDAMLQRAGISVDNPHPAANDLRGRSILNVAETMIGHRGSTFLGGASPSEIVQAAMTTSDFPDLLSGVAGKSLMLGYEREPASHRIWTRPVEVDDFKPVSRVALSEAPGLLEIPEHGTYKEGSLSDRAESYKLKRYGRVLKLTRQSIINDDLGDFARIPMAFGASAARLEADKVYGLLISNPSMSDGFALFSNEHNNLASTGAPLSVPTLGAARMAMRNQKGPNDGYLNIIPRYLIVPTAMESEAMVLLANEHFERVVDGDALRSGLAWVKQLELVVDPRLDADSTAAWYLAGSTSQVDTVEVAHLNGWKHVFTEDRQKFEDDSFEVKARLDFATQAIDWVGLYKNPGQ
ncbi:MAG: ATP-dependent Clp protease proteolytic subunit [Candidatus Thiodiazotropha sp. (ex. Lucinisca nassula)]|nr:ATP-dependent Clp protease proteolytic subunit [Candidatus Thiodiazotropha sp. (ex. Lucinisca nassula)]